MKSALVILFNQDYSKNIPKLEGIYSGRFSHIVYLVPDYWSRLHYAYISSIIPTTIVVAMDNLFNFGRRALGKHNPNELNEVIRKGLGERFRRVVGHQFYFYDFVQHASDYLLSLDVDWFWVVGDDAILNPALDEKTLPQAGDMSLTTDVVMCRPVIGSDAWITEIAGSILSARRRVESTVGSLSEIVNRHKIQSEEGAVENTDIAVACVDFFGVSRETLMRLVPVWRNCLKNRLYVEVGCANSLLAKSEDPIFVDDYDWQRVTDLGQYFALAQALANSKTRLFTHPIKLSALSWKELDVLRSS